VEEVLLMPVYEFYCEDCHTVFSFRARQVNTDKRPDCPKCGKPRLERQLSLFAISRGGTDPGGDEQLPDLDDAAMERAMAALASEADRIDEDDPKQVARMMRKLFDATGMKLGDGIEEAMRRMEAGEDPDKIEQEMGDLLDEGDVFAGGGGRKHLKSLRKKYLPPKVDDTLYEL
jgi:putative FmdB family regulatory protein